MKFFVKTASSKILASGLVYKKGDNRKLLSELLDEQKNFCAYTEKYIQGLDSCEVEHFNSAKKYNDDYYNYYAVIRKANQYKQDEKYVNSSFFTSLFFQQPNEFMQRVRYVDGDYEEINIADTEAKDFIDFLGLNNPILRTDRKRFITRLKGTFKDANYTNTQIIHYLKSHPEELNFITALENEFFIDLGELLETAKP